MKVPPSGNVPRRPGPALLALCVAAWVLAAAAVAWAATPVSQYRQRVREAALAVDSLVTLNREPDAGATARRAGAGGARFDPEAETLRRVRRLLPPSETVERAGERVEVNNRWLHAALDEYERTAAASAPSRRADALLRVAERLAALETRLAEAEAVGAQGEADKDAEKGRLAAILRGRDFNQKPAEGGALQEIAEQFFEWVRSLFPGIGPIRPAASPRASRAAQILVFALALGLIALLVWKYWRRQGPRGVSLRERGARVILGERLAPDQTPADLLAEAERLARGGDLRGAIRKAYVALLCELGDRKVVRLEQHKTNRDYLRAVRRAAPPLYGPMLALTDSFERHWYGLEAADELDWSDFRQRCRQALGAK